MRNQSGRKNVLVFLTLVFVGCSEPPITIEQYEEQATKSLTFDLQTSTPGAPPISQTIDGYTLTVDGLIAKARPVENQESDNIYLFGLGETGFEAEINLVDDVGEPANFTVESIGVSNNNQLKSGAREPPRCPIYATGLRNEKVIFTNYRIGPSYGASGQFNTFRFRQSGLIDTLVLKAKPTGKQYFPNFDNFVLRVGYVPR